MAETFRVRIHIVQIAVGQMTWFTWIVPLRAMKSAASDFCWEICTKSRTEPLTTRNFPQNWWLSIIETYSCIAQKKSGMWIYINLAKRNDTFSFTSSVEQIVLLFFVLLLRAGSCCNTLEMIRFCSWASSLIKSNEKGSLVLWVI